MAKKHFWQYLIDATGVPVNAATIHVYEAGTTEYLYISFPTEATAGTTSYATALTTNSDGFFEFWIGDEEETYGYARTQKMKVTWDKPAVLSGSIDNIDIFDPAYEVNEDSIDEVKNKLVSNLLIYNTKQHITNTALDHHIQYVHVNGDHPLTDDWNIGKNRHIEADKIQAIDNDGLELFNSDGKGIKIEDNAIVNLFDDIGLNLTTCGNKTVVFSSTFSQPSNTPSADTFIMHSRLANSIHVPAFTLYGGKLIKLTQEAHLANVSTDHTVDVTYDAADLKLYLDALGTKINQILTTLETVGLLASS